MELHLLPVILFLLLNGETLGQQQLLNVIPTGALGQTVYSTVPVTGQQLLATQAGVQPSVIQLLRQPGYGYTQVVGQGGLAQVVGQPGLTQVVGHSGLTQVVGQSGLAQVVGQPGFSQVVGHSGGLTQIVGGQPSLSQVQLVGGGIGLNGGGLVTTVPGVNVNGLTATTTGLPYGSTIGLAGTTATNVNGVPVFLSGASGVHLLNNGLQTVTTLPAAPLAQHPIVVREVPDEEETASVVQLDPMDAALLDMENKGQIHMEKYAWGRSALADKEKASSDKENTDRERKADLPVYLAPVPSGGVYNVPVITNNRLVPSPSRTRNPFIGEGGKRKKHFEHYEYFRNLDFTPQQVYVPMTVAFPPSASSPSASTPTA